MANREQILNNYLMILLSKLDDIRKGNELTLEEVFELRKIFEKNDIDKIVGKDLTKKYYEFFENCNLNRLNAKDAGEMLRGLYNITNDKLNDMEKIG